MRCLVRSRDRRGRRSNARRARALRKPLRIVPGSPARRLSNPPTRHSGKPGWATQFLPRQSLSGLRQGERACADRCWPLSWSWQVDPRSCVRGPRPNGGIFPTASIIQDPVTMTIIHPGCSIATPGPSASPHLISSRRPLSRARHRAMAAPGTGTLRPLTRRLVARFPSRLAHWQARHRAMAAPGTGTLRPLTRRLVARFPSRLVRWHARHRAMAAQGTGTLRPLTRRLAWQFPSRLAPFAASTATGATAFVSIAAATEPRKERRLPGGIVVSASAQRHGGFFVPWALLSRPWL